MTYNNKWITVESTSWRNLLPENDIAFHKLSCYCPCLPEAQASMQGLKRVLVHNSFDFSDLIAEGVTVVDLLEPIQFELPKAMDMEHFTGLEQ